MLEHSKQPKMGTSLVSPSMKIKSTTSSGIVMKGNGKTSIGKVPIDSTPLIAGSKNLKYTEYIDKEC